APAVLRLYDGAESQRSFGLDPDVNLLLAFDEGDATMVDAGMDVLAAECRGSGAERLDDQLVARWFGHRNEVGALEALIAKGYVVDTMEVSGPWSALEEIRLAATGAIAAVEGTLAASTHQSHSYLTGGCLYF